MVRTFVKLPSLAGVNRTIMFVAPNPAILKAALEMIENGPVVIVTLPLVNGSDPEFVAMKLAWRFEPTATVPKLRP